MRIFRRSRSHRQNVQSVFENTAQTNHTMYPVQVRRWSPFFRNIGGPLRVGVNPFQNCVNNHVPKCLERVSMSNILQGDRVENFSSECWLQDHLHQFGFVSEALPNLNEDIEEEVRSFAESFPSEDEEDDSPAGSDTSTSFNLSLSDYQDNDDTSLYRVMGGITTDISSYTEAYEPPPYDFPSEPPPTYEEAIGSNDTEYCRDSSGNNSRRSRYSDIGFLF